MRERARTPADIAGRRDGSEQAEYVSDAVTSGDGRERAYLNQLQTLRNSICGPHLPRNLLSRIAAPKGRKLFRRPPSLIKLTIHVIQPESMRDDFDGKAMTVA